VSWAEWFRQVLRELIKRPVRVPEMRPEDLKMTAPCEHLRFERVYTTETGLDMEGVIFDGPCAAVTGHEEAGE